MYTMCPSLAHSLVWMKLGVYSVYSSASRKCSIPDNSSQAHIPPQLPLYAYNLMNYMRPVRGNYHRQGGWLADANEKGEVNFFLCA